MATQNTINNTSGGITVTGTANINTTGSAISSMGTGGTGATNIGNATGNTAVTGSLTASTTLTATSGNITATNGSISVGDTASAATAQDVDFLKSRAGAVITTGDTLGIMTFKGHDGTGYITASQIQSVNSGTVATNRIASNLLFYTHPDSTTASTLRMTIASTGAVTIAAPDSGTGLTVSGGGATVTSGNLVATSGDITATAGNINLISSSFSIVLPATSGSQIKIGTNTLLRNLGGIFYGADKVSLFLGYNAGNASIGSHCSANVGIGNRSLESATGCQENYALGYRSLGALTGTDNSGYRNIAIGSFALYQLVGGNNTTDNGSYNTCIGYGAGNTYTGNEYSNILINYPGVAGQNNRLQIGTSTGTGTGSGKLGTAFICGIYNIAVGSTAGVVLADSSNQIGSLAGSANTVLVGGTKPSFTGSPSVSGSVTAGTGITVTAGGIVFTTTGTNGITSIDTFGRTTAVSGVPVVVDNTGLFGTVASSNRFKHDIVDMGDSSNSLMDLRPVMFTYNSNEDGVRSPGLIAEEVAKIMPDLVAYDQEGLPYTVKYNDLPAMLLNEIQKLRKRIEALEANNGI